MVADTCLPSQNRNFISVLFCYAKTPFLQALELHAAYSNHFLMSLHILGLEQFMLFFVVYERLLRMERGVLNEFLCLPRPLAVDSTFIEVASTPKPTLIANS